MMYNNYLNFNNWNMMGGLLPGMAFGVGMMSLVVLLLVWSLVWKGLALWKSARRANKVWFVVLLVTNTLGILDILYLYVFSEKSKSVE